MITESEVAKVLMVIILVAGFVATITIISKSTVDYAKIEFKHKDIEAVRCLNKIPKRRGRK